MYSLDVTKFVGTPRLDNCSGGLAILLDLKLHGFANYFLPECDRWQSDLAQGEVESDKLSFHL